MRSHTRLLLELMHGQRLRYTLAAGLLLVATAFLYGQPLVVGVAIDSVLGDRPASGFAANSINFFGGRAWLRDHLWLASACIVAATTFGCVFTFGKMRHGAIAAEAIARKLRDRLYGHLQHLPCSYHDKSQTGDLVQRCSSDVETVRLFYSDQILEILRASALLFTALPILFWLDWKMALIAVAMLPVIVAFAVIFFAKVRTTFKAMDEADGAMTACIQENLTGIRVVRAFARQDFEREKFRRKNNDRRAKDWRLLQVLAAYWSLSDLMCFSQMALILLIGAARVQSGVMTVGALVTFMMCSGLYIWPVRQMGRVITEMGKATVAIKRIDEILQAKLEAPPVVRSALPATPRGLVAFEHVTFMHRQSPVLQDISFTVEAGKTLALLGPSGSGKSTIAHLLMRFYDPQSGVIRIDGVDITTLEQKTVRSQIAAVMQEPFLFSRSLRENIRFARPSAQDADITEAASMAAVHESIVRFEKQYDTVLGERGITLSGGQRQRVAIARALLHEAPILILDDALSAVDTETESQIIEALRTRHGRRTTILIAHRLSTLMHADEILVIEHGRIVQRGDHRSLVSADGLYRRLWQIQTALEDDLQSAAAAVPEAVS